MIRVAKRQATNIAIRTVLVAAKAIKQVRRKATHFIKTRRSFIDYKADQQLRFLEELCKCLDGGGVDYCVAGGYAIEAKRGSITRLHSDVDIAFVDDQTAEIENILTRNGYSVSWQTHYKGTAQKGGLHSDLFQWSHAGDGTIEQVTGGSLFRIPKTFLTAAQHVCLRNLQFRIPSDEYFIATLPMVKNKINRQCDKDFIRSLNRTGKPKFSFDNRDVNFLRTVDVYDYTEPQRNASRSPVISVTEAAYSAS